MSLVRRKEPGSGACNLVEKTTILLVFDNPLEIGLHQNG
jgi:hypothetical protein